MGDGKSGKTCCSVCLFIIGVPLLLGGILSHIYKEETIRLFRHDDGHSNDVGHRIENAADKLGDLPGGKPYKDVVDGIANIFVPTTPKPSFIHNPEEIATAVSISMIVVGGLMVMCGLVLCCHGCCAANTPGQTIINMPVPMQPRIHSSSQENLLKYDDPLLQA